MHGVLPEESTGTCIAGAGTLLLEFGTLSRLLNDSTYENYAKTALHKLWSMRSTENIVGSSLDMKYGMVILS